MRQGHVTIPVDEYLRLLEYEKVAKATGVAMPSLEAAFRAIVYGNIRKRAWYVCKDLKYSTLQEIFDGGKKRIVNSRNCGAKTTAAIEKVLAENGFKDWPYYSREDQP